MAKTMFDTALLGLAKQRIERDALDTKRAFVTQQVLAGGGMPMGGQAPMGGQPPMMDPNAMGGQLPMDPSAMGGMGGPMPTDPSMGLPAMDPSMMGGAPPAIAPPASDPAAAPPAAPDTSALEQRLAALEQMIQSMQPGGPAPAPGSGGEKKSKSREADPGMLHNLDLKLTTLMTFLGIPFADSAASAGAVAPAPTAPAAPPPAQAAGMAPPTAPEGASREQADAAKSAHYGGSPYPATGDHREQGRVAAILKKHLAGRG